MDNSSGTRALYIGLDLGTSSCKGILTDRSGAVLREHSVEYPLSRPQPGWSEQDPEDWFQAVQTILAVLSDGVSDNVRGVGIAGQMHGLVMLDAADNVIRPAILWNDGRSVSETAFLNESGLALKYTGNLAFPGFTAPKILWVRANEPDNFRRACRICLPKDYIAYRLTGVFSTEYSDAAGMLLLDVEHKRWSPEMCEICGVTTDMLPALYESYQATGALKPEFGLKNAILCAGAGDNAGAAVGTNTLRPGECSISLGTSGTVFLPTDTFVKGTGELHNFGHANGRFHLMGCILSAASCNKWWNKDILDTAYDQFDPENLGRNRVLFAPYLTGERCPYNDTAVRGAFFGLSADTTRGEMTQAVLEGVAYALRDCVETSGLKPDRAVLCGGGAKGTLWRRIIANVMDADIYITRSEQGPSMGAALLAMTACGEYATVEDAAANTVEKSLAETPDPELVRLYAAGYAAYRKLYPALKALE